MKVFIAGGAEPFTHCMKGYRNLLSSFAYQREIKNKEQFYDKSSNIIIDSGAFTAFHNDLKIDVIKYGEWVKDYEKEWERKLNSLYFINLDSIGDQEQSDKNYEYLTSLGLKIIPVFTFRADIKIFLEMLKRNNYICLGGLVGGGKNKVKPWFDYCFYHVMKHYKATGIMPKIHLLGVTIEWVLQRYPVYSCDSSSWTEPIRFGGAKKAGINKVPRYNKKNNSKEVYSAVSHACIKGIETYKKLETDNTNLWASRGIRFDE